MIHVRATSLVCAAAVMSVGPGAARAGAQAHGGSIPLVVAQAAHSMRPGAIRFFDARLPDGWPAELVPDGARILGGSVTDPAMLGGRTTAVFEFTGPGDPDEVLATLLARAGYVERERRRVSTGGGFVPTAATERGGGYCRSGVLATFGPVDPAQAPRVRALMLLGGEAGRHSCSAAYYDGSYERFAAGLPTLTPPSGSLQLPGSASWSGESGSITSTLVTTMPVDSILAHYTAQLVAGGWRVEGRPAVTDGIALQRFGLRKDEEDWTGGLLVLTAGDRRSVRLELARKG